MADVQYIRSLAGIKKRCDEDWAACMDAGGKGQGALVLPGRR